MKIYRKGEKYSDYLLMSASDYSIKSVSYISEFWNSNYPKSFIDVTPNGYGRNLTIIDGYM